ncbi:sec-independent protein translocase TatC [Lewinellaceae bacterium SD302]|nr:sec-independent protein translocase TatC [Lewinellaceae bacterium SD302]
MKTDLDSRPRIEDLVQEFYNRARTDALLGPVFFGALGDGDWSHHLGVVNNFWCTVLLGERSYPGGFMWKHLQLPLRAEHVDRWRALFTDLVISTHKGPMTDEALRRVNIMAEVIKAKLEHKNGLL